MENYRKRLGSVGWDNAHCVVAVLCFLEQRLNMGAEGTFGDMVQCRWKPGYRLVTSQPSVGESFVPWGSPQSQEPGELANVHLQVGRKKACTSVTTPCLEHTLRLNSF